MRFGKMLAAAVFACSTMTAAVSDDFVRMYTGPNIGNSPERARKVFDGSIEGYEVRAAAAGVFSEYVGNTTYINGAARYNYAPLESRHYESGGVKRMLAKVQTFRQQTDSPKPYATFQMDIIFEDRTDGVYAWVDKMYQIASGKSCWLVSRDMATLAADATFSASVGLSTGTIGWDGRDIGGVSDYKKGYGIDHIIIQKISGPDKETVVTSPVDGDLAVEGDTSLVADGEAALADIEFTGDMKIDGTLTFRNPGELLLSGNMTGIGDVTYQATELRAGCSDIIETGRDFFITKNWKTVAEGRLLSSMTNCTGILCGTRIGGGADGIVPKAYAYWRNNGINAAVQAYREIQEAYQTGCVIYFRQSGANIQARIDIYSFDKPYENGYDKETYRYGDINFETLSPWNNAVPEGRDPEDGDFTDSKGNSLGRIGLNSLTLYFKENSAPHFVKFSGENTMHTGTVTRVEGSDSSAMMVDFASSAGLKGLPTYGALEVGRNGHAIISKVVRGEYLKAFDGGTIWQGTNQCVENTSTAGLVLSNGTFVCGYQMMNTTASLKGADSCMYLNHVALYDGSEVMGLRPRIGGSAPLHGARWYVGGTVPSSASCGMTLSSSIVEVKFPGEVISNMVSDIVFEVENVTRDEKADFTMTGDISLYNGKGNVDYETKKWIYVIKTGNGTFSMENSYSPYMPTKVRGGVWRFGVAAAASAETDFHLEGGDLEVAPGVALEIGEIVPGAGSRVVLGEGATLAMAEPSSEWPEGGVLDFIVPGGGSSVRIGDSPCVGAGYLAAMRLNGRRVMQNSTGHLRPVEFRMVVR